MLTFCAYKRLAKQDLDKLKSINNDFHGAGESTTDLSMEIVRGRIPVGVAILWHKRYDPLITVIRLEVDWCIAIKVMHNNNVFGILNVLLMNVTKTRMNILTGSLL